MEYQKIEVFQKCQNKRCSPQKIIFRKIMTVFDLSSKIIFKILIHPFFSTFPFLHLEKNIKMFWPFNFDNPLSNFIKCKSWVVCGTITSILSTLTYAPWCCKQVGHKKPRTTFFWVQIKIEVHHENHKILWIEQNAKNRKLFLLPNFQRRFCILHFTWDGSEAPNWIFWYYFPLYLYAIDLSGVVD